MSLRMGKNSLSGSIPSELRNLQKLRVLALDGNRLSGLFDVSKGILTASCVRACVRVLFTRNPCTMTGPIPPELCELPKLSDLRLHNNHLDQATDFRDAIMVRRVM